MSACCQASQGRRQTQSARSQAVTQHHSDQDGRLLTPVIIALFICHNFLTFLSHRGVNLAQQSLFRGGNSELQAKNPQRGGNLRAARDPGMCHSASFGPGPNLNAGERSDQRAAERNSQYPKAIPVTNPQPPETARRFEGGTGRRTKASAAGSASGSHWLNDIADGWRASTASAGRAWCSASN